MVGYVESINDPSYHGQILVQTYPLICNHRVIPSLLVGSEKPIRVRPLIREAMGLQDPNAFNLVSEVSTQDIHISNPENEKQLVLMGCGVKKEHYKKPVGAWCLRDPSSGELITRKDSVLQPPRSGDIQRIWRPQAMPLS